MRSGERIRFIVNRQEGGAAFMAEAHGKLTGRPGICFVTRGPGATNASIGVHNAFQDSTPMVLFVGDVGSDFRDREAFQEVDYGSFFGPSTKGFAKRVERIDDADRIPEYIARAFATAMNGRPGPVVLVLPEDMLRATTTARAPAARGGGAALERPRRLAHPARDAAGVAAAAGDRRRRRLDGAGGAGVAALRRELEAAGRPTPSATRTPSTTTIRCTPATSASPSTPSWRSA